MIKEAYFEGLNHIAAVACCDAQLHGLWDGINSKSDGNERHYCARRCRDEAEEAMLSAGDIAHYREELADVVIMALSSAAYLGIDIGAEVCRKMRINRDRPYRHGKEDGAC